MAHHLQHINSYKPQGKPVILLIRSMHNGNGLHIDTVVRSLGPPARDLEFENGQAAYQWYSSSSSYSMPIYFGCTYPSSYMNIPYTSYCSTIFYANEMAAAAALIVCLVAILFVVSENRKHRERLDNRERLDKGE